MERPSDTVHIRLLAAVGNSKPPSPRPLGGAVRRRGHAALRTDLSAAGPGVGQHQPRARSALHWPCPPPAHPVAERLFLKGLWWNREEAAAGSPFRFPGGW